MYSSVSMYSPAGTGYSSSGGNRSVRRQNSIGTPRREQCRIGQCNRAMWPKLSQNVAARTLQTSPARALQWISYGPERAPHLLFRRSSREYVAGQCDPSAGRAAASKGTMHGEAWSPSPVVGSLSLCPDRRPLVHRPEMANWKHAQTGRRGLVL